MKGRPTINTATRANPSSRSLGLPQQHVIKKPKGDHVKASGGTRRSSMSRDGTTSSSMSADMTLSEVGNLSVDDIDLTSDSVYLRGKGAKDRRVRFGPKTGPALSRYLQALAKHRGSDLPQLWLADRGPGRWPRTASRSG
jgi:hypothetical protein